MGFKKDDPGRIPKSSFSLSLVFYPVSTFRGTVQKGLFLFYVSRDINSNRNQIRLDLDVRIIDCGHIVAKIANVPEEMWACHCLKT